MWNSKILLKSSRLILTLWKCVSWWFTWYFIVSYHVQILKGERQRCQQIYDSYDRRKLAISGGCAMAAGFATYLGPYHHNFRRVILTVHWPNCLRERGIPLVIDSIDGLKGKHKKTFENLTAFYSSPRVLNEKHLCVQWKIWCIAILHILYEIQIAF